MALFNYATKEITIKIVYYGPGLSGKTTNLQYLHSILDPNTKGKLLSLATEADRTLFFDFLPVELGKLRDFSVRFQLYTVPGQVRYDATRKLVLKGADAVVFVADSQREMREQNIESLKNMHDNLLANNINPDDIPLIFQYNKRDLPNILPIDELNKDLNVNNKYDYIESVAINGTGVEDTFKHINKLVLRGIVRKHKIKLQPPEETVEPTYTQFSPEEMSVGKTVLEEPEPAIPIIESSRYESTEIKEPVYEIPKVKEKLPQTVMDEKVTAHREILVKEIKEVPLIPGEKLDMIINCITEISQTLKDLKNAASKFHMEIKDMKKEQKEINVILRDIRDNFENMKIKKSWFRFS
jgi:signal recognition particle receptor subunit beta